MKVWILTTLLIAMLTGWSLARAEEEPTKVKKSKKVIMRKTQSVDFTEETVDGAARNPDGSYVVQKRSVDFVPLYKVREHFDENIKQSIEYLK